MDKLEKMGAAFRDKVAGGAKNILSLSKETREFDNLIKAIGECKSKAEEDRIITAELEILKTRLSDPKLDRSRGREYMVRLIYCEMLGHDASFAYIKAVQFASEASVHTKKAAYLALMQFLDHNSELVLLLVNTLLSDLKSDNYIVVSTALVVVTKLIGPDLINAVYPVVVERLRHPKENVRKKAVMALHRFQQLDPRHEGPLAGVDLDRHFRTMLCDKDPSVMSAALCALHEVIKNDPKPYKNLIPSFTSILKQVAEHRLPKSYDYHRFPAPFIQIKLLKVLAALGVGDRPASENMYAVIAQTLRRANGSHTIGNALIFECVRTITTIYPNPPLLAAAADAIAAFLRSPSHNLRYVGIDALSGIVRINPASAAEHQLAVIDCLEDPDDSLKLKTLELLYRMTKANNVEVIVERMMSFLRGATDEHVKRDIVRKVSELAERYAPSPSWFITVVSEVFELGGEHVDAGLAHNLCRLIAEQDEELHTSAVAAYLSLLDKRRLPEVLLMVAVWVLGEYGHLAVSLSPQQVMDRLLSAMDFHRASDSIKAYTITAIAKLAARGGDGGAGIGGLTPAAASQAHLASSSADLELQQRAHELLALASAPMSLQASVLPPDASCEDFDESELATLRNGTFLSWFVDEALAAGAAPYLPDEQRGSTTAASNGDKGHLRFEAYEPAAPPPLGPSSSNHSNTAGYSSNAYDPYSAQVSGGSTSASLGGRSSSAAGHGSSASDLRLKAAAGSKWGPAQFESSRPSPPSHTASAAPSTSPYTTHDLLGGSPTRPLSSSSSSAAVHPPPPKPLSERDRLAASLFGGGGGSMGSVEPSAGSGSSSSGQRTAGKSSGMGGRSGTSFHATAARAPTSNTTVDLLGGSPTASSVQSLSSTSATGATAAQPPRTDLDLLMDLDAPISVASPVRQQQPSLQPSATTMDPFSLSGLGSSLPYHTAPSPSVPVSPPAVSSAGFPSLTGPHAGGMLLPNLELSPPSIVSQQQSPYGLQPTSLTQSQQQNASNLSYLQQAGGGLYGGLHVGPARSSAAGSLTGSSSAQHNSPAQNGGFSGTNIAGLGSSTLLSSSGLASSFTGNNGRGANAGNVGGLDPFSAGSLGGLGGSAMGGIAMMRPAAVPVATAPASKPASVDPFLDLI